MENREADPIEMVLECTDVYDSTKMYGDLASIYMKIPNRFYLLWLDKLKNLTTYDKEIEYCLSEDEEATLKKPESQLRINLCDLICTSLAIDRSSGTHAEIFIKMESKYLWLWMTKLGDLETNMQEIAAFELIDAEQKELLAAIG